MATLKFKIIKNKSQYKEYCKMLDKLLRSNPKDRAKNEEIDMLTLLIEKWDEEHNTFDEIDPIQLLHSLMNEHNLKSKNLVKILGITKGYVSDILNYKKGLSKEVIRTLSEYFKVRQEAFNRFYKLKSPVNSHLRNSSVMNTRKKLVTA
jgi:HTH-type transcriptional regulator / antitoxin HigA